MIYDEEGLDLNLAICQAFYMDKLGVQRSYESCNMTDKYAPQHYIAADGVFTFFKFRNRPTPPLSNDGSREYIEKQPKVTLIDYPGYQQDKRTAYINKAVELECDAIIVIDTDEYLHPDWKNWKEFRQWLVRYARSYDPGAEGFIFNLYSWIDKNYIKAYNTTEVEQFTLVPRVWHSPKNLEYYNGVHYWVRRKNTKEVNQHLEQTHIVLEYGIRLAQDSTLRNPAFNEARDNWAKSGIYHEDILRKRYAMAHGLPYVSIYNKAFGITDESIIKSLNPLVVCLVTCDNNDTIQDIKKMINVDKLFITGYESRQGALNKARDFFLKHEEYSHMMITSNFYNAKRADVNMLGNVLASGFYDIVGGICHYPAGFVSYSTLPFDFRDPVMKYDKSSNQTTNEDGLIDVFHTDFVLIGISRKVLEQFDFDYKPEQYFCWDVVKGNYKIWVHPKIDIKMGDNALPSAETISTMFFEKRYVDIDSFMA